MLKINPEDRLNFLSWEQTNWGRLSKFIELFKILEPRRFRKIEARLGWGEFVEADMAPIMDGLRQFIESYNRTVLRMRKQGKTGTVH